MKWLLLLTILSGYSGSSTVAAALCESLGDAEAHDVLTHVARKVLRCL